MADGQGFLAVSEAQILEVHQAGAGADAHQVHLPQQIAQCCASLVDCER